MPTKAGHGSVIWHCHGQMTLCHSARLRCYAPKKPGVRRQEAALIYTLMIVAQKVAIKAKKNL